MIMLYSLLSLTICYEYCWPGPKWIRTATKRREPKEGHWLNGRIMSFMAKLLRGDKKNLSCVQIKVDNYNPFKVKSQLDGPGLLLDFHGQTHAGNRTELGYAISSDGD